MKPSFDKKVLFCIGVVLAIFIVVSFLLNNHIKQVSEDDRWVVHTYEVALRLKDVFSDIERIESSKGDFLLSGEEKVLEAYHLRIVDFVRLSNQLRSLLRSPDQKKRFEHLEALTAQKLAFVKEVVDLRQQKGQQAARDLFLTGKGQKILDEIRIVENELENKEQMLLKQREENEERSIRQVTFIIRVGILIAFVIIFITIFYILREIGIRRKAEEKVEDSKEFLSNIINSLGDPVFIKDRQHTWILLNDAFCEFAGHTREELIGKSDYDFFHKEDADVFWSKDELVFNTGETNINEEGFTDIHGRKHVLLTKKVLYKSSNGELYIVGVLADITELKKITNNLEEAKKELEETKMFLDSIIENIPNMVFVKDAKELRFVRFNKAGEELIGITRQEMIGKNDYDIFPKEEADFFTQKDREVLSKKGGILDISQEKIDTKKGIRILHTKKVAIADEKGNPKYLLGISEDVTDIKLAEKKLKETLDDLKRSNQELEQFAYVASHDLQEPLGMVASFCQLLELRYKNLLDDNGKKYIDYAVDGAKRMQRMIDDLLIFARAGKDKIEKTPVDLNKVLEKVLLDLEIVIKEKKATINVSSLPIVVASHTQMVQLFQNFLSNALKFNGAAISIINISVEKKGNYWEFVIADNGIGIEEQYFEQIFIIFKRLHSPKEYPGVGIGLSLCKKIVENYGGKIWVKSKLGKGTSFYFTLPVQEK